MSIFLNGDPAVELLELVTVLNLVTKAWEVIAYDRLHYRRAHGEVILEVGLSDGNVPPRPEYRHCS